MAYSIEAAARALPDFGLDDQIEPGEDPSYLARQLVTYIWNKRSLATTGNDRPFV